MIELLKAQLVLADSMRRVASNPGERGAWVQYHSTIQALLDQLQRPPPPDRPPPVITRP